MHPTHARPPEPRECGVCRRSAAYDPRAGTHVCACGAVRRSTGRWTSLGPKREA
jgi:hypothetical protein